MPDHPIYTCKTCHYSGPEIETIHGQSVECRIERPNGDGFPIMPVDSWCWDGAPNRDLVNKITYLTENGRL